jgi:phosphatidylglycerophosphate synthase
MSVDEHIAKYMVDSWSFLRYVSPNFITCCGMVCNYLIHSCIFKPNMKITVFVLFNIRCLSDILDGAVARKYNKKSRVGHIMDTVCDYTNMVVLTNYLFYVLKWEQYHFTFIITWILVSELQFSMLTTHDILKNSKGFGSFYVNNTFIFNNIFYLMYLGSLLIPG